MVKRNLIKKINLGVISALIFAFALIWFSPILWMVSTSLKPEKYTIEWPIHWIPRSVTLENYYSVIFESVINIFRPFFNSLFIASAVIVLTLLTSSLAAYAFSQLRFKGQNVLFFLVISTLMIPEEVLLVPRYLLLYKLQMINSYNALILPMVASPFGIFLLRQFFLGIPRDLQDAARIDGCSKFRIYYQIILPLSKPALAALAIFTFLANWNSFTWPLIAIDSIELMTVPIFLATFHAFGVIMWGRLMAAVSCVTLPILIFFCIAQRGIIKGITLTGLKG
ncbi:ABC transporter permease [Candidatus Aerophobetes bacterium Ae_b3a]|nr:MAG: ABC transporter permease [Candidatus Aerophobetes bacterium Ae_b3a]